jgi:hypothetical protein
MNSLSEIPSPCWLELKSRIISIVLPCCWIQYNNPSLLPLQSEARRRLGRTLTVGPIRCPPNSGSTCTSPCPPCPPCTIAPRFFVTLHACCVVHLLTTSTSTYCTTTRRLFPPLFRSSLSLLPSKPGLVSTLPPYYYHSNSNQYSSLLPVPSSSYVYLLLSRYEVTYQ